MFHNVLLLVGPTDIALILMNALTLPETRQIRDTSCPHHPIATSMHSSGSARLRFAGWTIEAVTSMVE